jgi:peptidoglycan/xylan/chitin deacetylase (PgdA/CDA1 family)
MAAKRIITTSWDDGHPLDFRLAEMLASRNLRATFYIPRNADTGTMSADNVRELSQQFEIGAHTLDHVFLDRASDEQADTQIRNSKKWVEDVTGKPCTMFCPPAGKFAKKHLQMIEGAGYAGVRSVEFFSFDPPRRVGKLLMMPTTLQANPNGLFSYARNLARRLAIRNLWLYIRHGHNTDWAKLSKSLLDFFQHTGGVFHLWGHSWELEAHAQWERLAEVLDLLQSCATSQTLMTNGEICASTER